MIGWAVGMIILLPTIAVLGYVGRLYFGTNIKAAQSMLATATIIPWYIGGLMMAAAVAFIITTGDSYLLSGATNLATDVYNHFKKDATDREVLRATQWSIVIFGALALGILKFFPSILAIQYWSYTIVGAGITPALIGCIVCPDKVSKWGGDPLHGRRYIAHNRLGDGRTAFRSCDNSGGISGFGHSACDWIYSV